MDTKQLVTERKIADVMTPHVETLTPVDTIKDAVSLMVDCNLTTIPVVNGDFKCVGIISRSDLTDLFMQADGELSKAIDTDRLSLEWFSHSLDTADVRQVKELMTYEVTTVRADQTLVEACREMVRMKIHHLPVVDNHESVIGIVSAFDVVTAMANS